MYRSRAGPMDYEYESKSELPNIFARKEKEPLITEKTEVETGVKRTFSSAGLSTPSPSFTFQQSPKDVKPYVSGLGHPFLFALPNSVAKEADVPDNTVAASQRKISQNAVLRARKRRAKENLFGSGFRKRLYEIAGENESASDSDSDTFDQKPLAANAENGKPMTENQASKTEFDGWNAPQYDYAYIISGYIQTGFNLFIVLVMVYLAVQVILTIQRDVQQKVDEYSSAIVKEISVCAKLYYDNRCDPENRVPAMDESCRNWETCMDRDPDIVGRAKVSAETFAEIVNGFIDPISYKSMLFFLVLIFGSLIISNCAFGMYRSRHLHQYQELVNTHVGGAYGNSNLKSHRY
ncbi:hypothetical protein INT43_004800 [Umbelopsis isabellina]|uniref:Brl1/Brr6 domain-containing protein n=1 Tax=Mortierella isabellina TaxID=91625 RepID=A0A8H7PE53_MORIS|nr:hypothetical protein INT43_004800 [Umbelopsis isabellina]